MFLSQRTTQAEYFDIERPLAEMAEFYRSLNRTNRMFLFAEPFQRVLPRMLGEEACRELTILDLGAGDGSLGKSLSQWAEARGWKWRVVNLDQSTQALGLGETAANVAASALALPFRESSFDVVIASQMTHHLLDRGVRQHLREAWRVARRGILISDLHRNALLYCLLWLAFQLGRFPKSFRLDGLLSVRRAWRVKELRTLCEQAGIGGAHVQLYYGARILLQAQKRTDNESVSPM